MRRVRRILKLMLMGSQRVNAQKSVYNKFVKNKFNNKGSEIQISI